MKDKLAAPLFGGSSHIADPPWFSSYSQNNYGDFFCSLVRVYQPQTIVELGTKTGYSAYHLARGLRANGQGHLDCYDLWEKLPQHPAKSIANENLAKYRDLVSLNLRNAIGVDTLYTAVDILHIDLDNDGELLEKIVPKWIDKVRQLIVIEGGSSERDLIDTTSVSRQMPVNQWLDNFDGQKADRLKQVLPELTDENSQFVIVSGDVKYKTKPIADWLRSFSARRKDISYFTIEPFPSLTLIKKK